MPKAFQTDLVLARARYDQAEAAEEKQLARELEDLRFLVDQWPDDLKASRGPQQATAGVSAIPARPCLTIDTLRDPIAHVAAEAQQTDLGPEIVPADDFAGLVGPIDDTEIELREGLVRKIQRESGARDARNWAADRARKAGRGYYLVMTRYVSQRSRDQEVYITRLYNQGTVRLDPRHDQPDGRDADWEFWGTTMSWEVYQATFPQRASKTKFSSHGSDDEWRGLGDEAPAWFTTDGDTKSVRVMNYCWTTHTPTTLVELADGRCVPQAEAKGQPTALDEDGQPIMRIEDVKTIIFAKIDGAQVLEETVWPSEFMPLVKVLWEEVQPYDEERRVQGMVRPARDPAFGVSVMATTEVEVALLAPKTPITGLSGQFTGFESAWDQANVRNIGRLEYNGFTDEYPVGSGTPLPAPSALVRNTEAAVGTWDGLREMFVRAVKSTTGVPDATLGNVDPSVRSGRAIKLLQERATQGTSGGLANLVKSVTYEAQIVNSLLYPIYGTRPGRLMQIMTGKYESQGVLVGQPFVRDAKQRPVPFDPTQHQGQEPKTYQLTEDATFNLAIRVAKDYDTRRQEETSVLGELIGGNPELLTWFGDLFFENQDGPGHKDMAERAKLMLAAPIQASLNKQQGGGIPPEVQAQLQQMQQQLQQAMQFIQTKQAEQQGQVAQAKVKADADVQIAHINNAAKIAVARITAAQSLIDIQAEAAEERLATGLEQQHELGMAGMQQQHDAGMQQRTADAASAQQGAAQQHETTLSDADRQQQAQLAAQAAQHQTEGGV